MKKGNEPIYPIEGSANAYSFSGITLRQHFAGLAMQGLLSMKYWHEKDAACHAVKCADALLAELEKSE